MSYSNGHTETIRLPAAVLTSAATLGRFIGPSGMTGRLIDIRSVVTTGVTVAAATVTVGTVADPDAYGTLTVAISSANAVQNGMTRGADNIITADTVMVIDTGGEATAGAADLLVTIEWS